jgi:hypothetical protein
VPDRFFWALPPADEEAAATEDGGETPAGDTGTPGSPRRVH